MKQKQPEYKIQIEYDRLVNGYKPGQTVAGYIKLSHTVNKSFKQDVNSVRMKVKGQIAINYANNAKKYSDFQNNPDVPSVVFIQNQPKQLIRNQTIDQSTKLPFRFKLEQNDDPYQESYIGMFLSVNYLINVEVQISKGRVISNDIPFYVQVFQAGRGALEGKFQHPKPKSFFLSDNQLPAVPEGIQKPKFRIKGQFSSQICMFNDDFEGYLIIDSTQTPIKTVDIQLMRVETLTLKEKTTVEKTEVQLIQVCDGNVTPKLEIPIYMMFPKYHSCPSVNYKGYKIDFEVNLNVVFKGGFKVSINQPIKILRS